MESKIITLNDPEMALAISALKNANIHASAARLVVSFEDKLILSVKTRQEGLLPEQMQNLEYDLELNIQEANLLCNVISEGNCKGGQARQMVALIEKVEPIAQWVKDSQQQSEGEQKQAAAEN